MRRVIVTLLLVLTVPVAHAQGTHRIRFAAAPGLSFPVGPDKFSDFWTIGPAVSAGLSYSASSHFAVFVMLDGTINSVNEEKAFEVYGITREGVDAAGGRVTMLTAMGSLKAYLRSPTVSSRPYVYAGTGLYRIATSAGGIRAGSILLPLEPPATETTAAAQLGAGVEFATSGKVNIFLEGRYLIGFTENESTRTVQFRVGVVTN